MDAIRSDKMDVSVASVRGFDGPEKEVGMGSHFFLRVVSRAMSSVFARQLRRHSNLIFRL